MDYIEYELNFYKERLQAYENEKPSREFLHEAQVLLKMLIDFKKQGYIRTYNLINEKHNAENRLKKILAKNKIKPLKSDKKAVKNLQYSDNKIALTDYLNRLQSIEYKGSKCKLQKFLKSYKFIFDYSKWLSKFADKDTAYIFLLRDTLLPYFALKAWNKDIECVPLLVGRKFLSLFASKESIKNNTKSNLAGNANFGDSDECYEMLYSAIFSALNNQNKDYDVYQRQVSGFVNKKFKEFLGLKTAICSLLGKISKKKIMIIESGRFASLPMLFTCVNPSIDFRLFTTTPHFYSVYKDKFFTDDYSGHRKFESLLCQDALFTFADFKDGKFYVKETLNKKVKKKALTELRFWLTIIDEYS